MERQFLNRDVTAATASDHHNSDKFYMRANIFRCYAVILNAPSTHQGRAVTRDLLRKDPNMGSFIEDFFKGRDTGLVIDWTQMPTYNTIMAIAAGAGLVFMFALGRALWRDKDFRAEGWALTAGVLGLILTTTGLHMTLTWPFAAFFPFDNIIFGEPSLAFGVLLLAASLYLWKRGDQIVSAEDRAAEAAAIARPMGIFVLGTGLALVGIAFAGIIFGLFAAPAEEPVSGMFADFPMIEATFMSLLFGFIGLGAALFPIALRGFSSKRPMSGVTKFVGYSWLVTGVIFLLFGALNFYTHIGLVVNTMQ